MIIANADNEYQSYKQRLESFSNNLDIGLLIDIIIKCRWWYILFFGIAGISVFLYLRYSERIYQSQSVIQIVNSEANQILQINPVNSEGSNKVSEAIEQIRSKTFLERIVDILNLQITYYNEGTFKNHELYKNSPYFVDVNIKQDNIYEKKIYVKFNDDFKSGYILIEFAEGSLEKIPFTINNWMKHSLLDFIIRFNEKRDFKSIQQDLEKNLNTFFVVHSKDAMATYLQKKLEVKPLNDLAQTISIAIKDVNPQKTTDIVNTIAEEYLNYDVERKSESSKNILNFINSQLSIVYEELKNSETKLNEFKKQKNIITPSEHSALNTSQSQIYSSVQEQLLQIELNERLLDEILNNIQNQKNIDLYQLISLANGTSYEESIRNITNNIQKLLLEKENLLYQVTPNSEQIKILNYQIENQKKILIETLYALKQKYRTQYRNLLERKNEVKTEVYPNSENEIELTRLTRIYSINEKYYTLLLEKKTEYSISKAGFVSQNIILEKAYSAQFVSPSKKSSITLGALSAFLLSFLLVFFKYVTNDVIYSLSNITKATNANVSILGIIPMHKKKLDVSQLVVDKNSKSIIAEAFRSLRSNMQFIDNSPGPKIVALTSTISGEGKTFVAVNLAGILEFAGKKVIILDLDMRKPKVDKAFGLSNEKGMSTLLSGIHSIDECIQQGPLPNLKIITAGPLPPNPSELVLSERTFSILEELKKKYDYIILDNPPIGLVSDATPILQKADIPIYVFRANYSKMNFVQIYDRLKNENKITKLSVVLNSVEIKKNTYGYNYGYGYGYGYGYMYGKQSNYYVD
ncbi:MAG: sugar transporter [Bacteroidia bacterium]|nr:MAG: sugar transporter [Bacteroidia bacterium]